MIWIRCTDCQGSVHLGAETCPFCGAPNRVARHGRRVLVVWLLGVALGLAALIAGCGN